MHIACILYTCGFLWLVEGRLAARQTIMLIPIFFFYYGTHTSRPQSLVLMRAGMCVIACVRVSLSPLTTSCGRLLRGLISFSLSLILFLPSVLTKKKTKQKKRESCPDNNTKNTHRNTHIHARRTDVMINLLTLGSASGRYACVSVCECCSHTVSVWTLVGQLRINCSHLLAELSSLFSLTLFLSLDDWVVSWGMREGEEVCVCVRVCVCVCMYVCLFGVKVWFK